MPRTTLHRLAIFGCSLVLAGTSLVAQQVIVPEDPIPEAPIALQEMRANYLRLAKATPQQLQDYLERVGKLRKAAEAYAGKGNATQAALYYQQALEGITKLAAARPQWQTEEVQQQKNAIQSAVAALPQPNPALSDETASIALLSDEVKEGKLTLSWSLRAVNLSADEASRHLDVAVSSPGRSLLVPPEPPRHRSAPTSSTRISSRSPAPSCEAPKRQPTGKRPSRQTKKSGAPCEMRR